MTIGSEAKNDFDNEILVDLKRTVTYTPVTITRDNITGDDIKTTGNTSSKDWVFLKRSQKFVFDKEGVVEQGDAYVMVPSTDTINVGDRVTVDGEVYEINASDSLMVRHFNGSVVYKYAVLSKFSGDQT